MVCGELQFMCSLIIISMYHHNRYIIPYLQIHKLKEALLANLQVLRLIDDPQYLSLRQFRKLLVRYLVLAIQLHQRCHRAIKGLPFFLPIYLPPPRQQHIVIHHLVKPLLFHLLSFLSRYILPTDEITFFPTSACPLTSHGQGPSAHHTQTRSTADEKYPRSTG